MRHSTRGHAADSVRLGCQPSYNEATYIELRCRIITVQGNCQASASCLTHLGLAYLRRVVVGPNHVVSDTGRGVVLVAGGGRAVCRT